MNRESWLEERRHSIGGSDAAAIVGMSEWSTPYTVWADKTGRIPPKEDNESMRQGRDLEQYVATRFCEATGKKVRVHGEIIRSKKYPFAHGTIDRKVVGERAGLECKTTSVLNLKRFKDGDFPANYYAQCVHYLAVTGWERWYLAVCVLGREFLIFTIERNEDEIRALMEAEASFWTEYVEKDTPPPVDGLDPTGDALRTIYADTREGSVDLFDRAGLLKEYMDTERAIRILQKENEERRQQLMEDLGENDRGSCEGFTVTWKKQTRQSFDLKAFRSDHEDLDLEPYMKTSEYRVFKVKEKNDDK